MTNLERLEKKAAEAEAQKSSLTSKVELLKKQIAESRIDSDNAAVSGDVETYKKLKSKIADLEDELFIAERQLEKAKNPITKDEARSGWLEDSKTYNKAIEKAYKEYQATLAKLFPLFSELLKLQRESLAHREKFALLAGEELDSLGRVRVDEYPAVLVKASDVKAELEYFLNKGHYDRLTMASITSMLNTGLA